MKFASRLLDWLAINWFSAIGRLVHVFFVLFIILRFSRDQFINHILWFLGAGWHFISYVSGLCPFELPTIDVCRIVSGWPSVHMARFFSLTGKKNWSCCSFHQSCLSCVSMIHLLPFHYSWIAPVQRSGCLKDAAALGWRLFNGNVDYWHDLWVRLSQWDPACRIGQGRWDDGQALFLFLTQESRLWFLFFRMNVQPHDVCEHAPFLHSLYWHSFVIITRVRIMFVHDFDVFPVDIYIATVNGQPSIDLRVRHKLFQ